MWFDKSFHKSFKRHVFMNITLTSPSFNNRLADSYGQTRTVDKTLKFGSSLSSLVSNILSYNTTENSAISGKAISSLGKTFSSIRSGMKVFDIMQDFSTPSGDVHETRMKFIQMVCFASADALNPVFFLENQGFYSIDAQTKDVMGNTATSFGLVGVATSLVNTAYQLSKASAQFDHVQSAINNRHISEELLQGLKDQHRTLETELQRLKQLIQEYPDQLCNEDVREHSDALPFLEHSDDENAADPSIGNPQPTKQQLFEMVRNLEPRIADLLNDIRISQTLLVGREVAAEKVFKNELTIIEKVMDLAAIVFSFASSYVAPAVFVPVMAVLGLISSTIALAKIWRESGFTNEVNAQLSAAMRIPVAI